MIPIKGLENLPDSKSVRISLYSSTKKKKSSPSLDVSLKDNKTYWLEAEIKHAC